MDFADQIQAVAGRVSGKLASLNTEEATKNALVMPFINALGYNVFDPTELVPEFTADVTGKKGEKVDYAIMKDGRPIILFECKSSNANLDQAHTSQLFRYFTSTDARFGVLTNGVLYRFYSDIDKPNMMDAKPFLEVNMLGLTDAQIEELKRFTKPSFDLDNILDAARELKYTREITHILGEQLANPTDDFVRFFATQVYSGRMTQSAKEQFTQISKRAFQQFINEKIADRLRWAQAREEDAATSGKKPPGDESTAIAQDDSDEDSGIVTTEEEIQGYYIVKAVLADSIDVTRIAMRDVRSYCGVLLDDNNRKPVCRLRFNAAQKYLGLFDNGKEEERVQIDGLDDIYRYSDRLKATITLYESSEHTS